MLGAMWRHRWLSLLFILVVTAAGVGFAFVSAPKYEAVASLVVEDPIAGSVFEVGSATSPERYVADQAAILGSAVVAGRAVSSASGLDDPEELLEELDIVWSSGSNLIEVAYEAESAESAIEGANAVASVYQEMRREATSGAFTDALTQLEDSIVEVEAQLAAQQEQIVDLIEDDPSLEALESQLSDALARLVTLQSQLPSAGPEAAESLREEIDDVQQQIQMTQSVLSLQAQGPQMELLLEEQRQTIARQADLIGRRDELGVEARLESTGIVLYSPAITAEPAGATPVRTGAVGFIVGGLFAASVAYLRAVRNRNFDDRYQPERVLGEPLLAEVPIFRSERIRGELPVISSPASVSAEAFRFIAAALDVESEQSETTGSGGAHLARRGSHLLRSFAVVSPSPGDGKTVVAANTALASARQGKRVLAIDADFGNQNLSQILTGEKQLPRGLTDLVVNDAELASVTERLALDGNAVLDLLGRGSVPMTAPDFFRSAGAREFFNAIRDEYDLIVLDTPPLLHVAYSSLIVRYVDRVLIVVGHGAKVSPTEELSNRLGLLDTEAIGYIYNQAPLRDDMTLTQGSLADVLGQPMDSRSHG